VTGPLEPRRTLEYYADLMDVYGIDAVDMDRWIESHQRHVPVAPGAQEIGRRPAVPGTLYVRAAAPPAGRGRVERRLLWPLAFLVAAVAALALAGWIVYRAAPGAPAPCSPGSCQQITPPTIEPTAIPGPPAP
jgi:hypothetical protein